METGIANFAFDNTANRARLSVLNLPEQSSPPISLIAGQSTRHITTVWS